MTGLAPGDNGMARDKRDAGQHYRRSRCKIPMTWSKKRGIKMGEGVAELREHREICVQVEEP